MTITIITATYNRRELLKRLFRSLLAQHFDAIEWIIVDDGGTDNTEEAVETFRRAAPFEIKYVRKPNSGKNATVNVGLDLATGDLVAIIDDDDYFRPHVFRSIARDFTAIADKGTVAGLSYLSTDCGGAVWGKKFPTDRMLSDHFDCRINGKIWGDKCEFTKGSVLRENRFRFLETRTPGGLASDVMFLTSIAEKYLTCYINDIVLVKNYYDNGIAVNWRKSILQNPELAAAYYACYLHPRVRVAIRLRYMVAYVAICRFAGYPLRPPATHAPWGRALFVLAYLPGLIAGLRWLKYRSCSHPQARRWMRSGA